jgi:oligosaccharide repeat unit polymerase
MSVPQIISLTVLIFIILASVRKGSDIFSPAKVFLFVWAVAILLTEFKFSGYQHQWSAFSWFVLLSGLFSFLLGLFVAYTLKADQRLLSIKDVRSKIKKNIKFDRQRLFITISLLFIAYMISFIVEVIFAGFIPIFHPKPDMARMEFGVFGIHLIVSQMPVILFLIVEYLVLGSESRKKTLSMFIFFITVFITYFLLLQRFNYIYWLVISLALLYYATRKINFKNVALFSIFFTSFLSVLTSIRLSQYATQFLYVISKMKYSAEYASFTGPYMYIVMNLENMARAVDKLGTNTYSIMTLDWLYALFGLKHWMREYFNIIQRPFLNSSFNTYPFMWDFFYDFGIAGVVLISLVIGLTIGLIYYDMRIKGTLDLVIYYAIGLFFILISFFTNIFTLLNVVMSILLLWSIHRFFILRPNKTKKNLD